MQNKLLPCPFCGGEAKLLKFHDRCHGTDCKIFCSECDVIVQANKYTSNADYILKKYNTRKPMERIVEQLEEELELAEKEEKRFLWNIHNEKCIAEIRNKAIDEFAEKIELGISESVIWDTLANANKNSSLSDTSDRIFDYVVETIKDLAEQMKGAQNE